MTLPDRIKNAYNAFVSNFVGEPSADGQNTQYPEQYKADKKDILLDIRPLPNPRVREEIASWRQALITAEHPEFPRRYRLYQLYENGPELDAHLSGLTAKRTEKLQLAKFKIINKAAKENPD